MMTVNMRLFLFVGCLGAFTTFSTFCLENINLIRDGEYYFAGLNIVLSNVLGIFFVFAGLVFSRFILNVVR